PRAFIEKYVIPGMEATFVPRGTFNGGFFSAMKKNEKGEYEEIHDPEWGMRHRSNMLFAKLMGAMREEAKAGEGDTNYNVTFNLVNASDDDLRAIIRAGARARSRAGIPDGPGRVVPALPNSVAPRGQD